MLSPSAFVLREINRSTIIVVWFVCMQCYRECSGKRLLTTEREVKKLSGTVIPQGSLKEKLVDVRKLEGVESRERGQHGQ